MEQSIADINAKIRERSVRVLTLLELQKRVAAVGLSQAAAEVDVVTTGTFAPIESAGVFINLGHTDPPLRLRSCWLDGVLAYSGMGAVDLFLGATQEAEPQEERPIGYGGAHVIAKLVAGESVPLRAIGMPNDCYPRATFETHINRDSINQFYLYAPRGLYQNFVVGVNSGEEVVYTYLGPLLPRMGNAVYANPGVIAPLWHSLETIGIGTKIFLGGGIGFIAWEGTQHFPNQKQLENHMPIGPAATLALIGDAKQMDKEWVKGCYLRNYGVSLMVGVGVPIPVLNEKTIESLALQDEEIMAPVIDFSIPRRVRPSFGLVSYAQLKSGKITVNNIPVRTAPIVSISRAEQVASILKDWIIKGEFTLTEPIAAIPPQRQFLHQDLINV
ncbi:MAG: homocysteine biosynthesis protein [Pseudanabaenaceae cyanobacterium SKYGB_i_bin29]|nr:homocysteine biosynthesis protein [Pseudanabaenaceae cyanobacterium SKYG29]MDW8420944.1 homocysteine biosynthesis protein [Pseudanabaenaceae cyanobacterium SKYGB_i_bin29]